METFLQTRMFVDDSRVAFQLPELVNDLGSGTPPIQLQPQLLLFLLIYHRDRYAIYDIIERFIEKVRGQLHVLDFKKTRTGVTRCFTNTRFAAHTLRDYGLLKFTHNEAFKTWMLSLTGFVVASRVLEKGVGWELPAVARMYNFDIHPEIRLAWADLQSYDAFVARLRYICEPNVEVFKTFDTVLRRAFELLPGYWDAMQDHQLTQRDRKAETARRIAELDRQSQMAEFYREFSACVNVERLMKDVD